MADAFHPQALEALLDFYVEAGVDAALNEEPVDRFALSAAQAAAQRAPAALRPAPDQFGADAKAPAAPAMPARLPAKADLAASAEEAARSAKAIAAASGTLDELRDALANFDGCALKMTAKSLCFADGTPGARLMLIGEAPGADEDRVGLPFVGRSGQLLNRMLAAIGLAREDAYIANVVPWRPPGNRAPTPQEAAICRPFIMRQIELCDPDVLVCLGGPAMQALMNIKDGILKSRGRWQAFDTGARQIRAMATLHPAYLLRQPAQKRLAWRDFKALKQELAAIVGEKDRQAQA